MSGRIISIAPVGEPWEYLYVSTERGCREIFAEPVIAWGLAENGKVEPVTATGNLQSAKPHALRRVEDGRIFSSDGQYGTKEEWLKALRDRQPTLNQDEKAAEF